MPKFDNYCITKFRSQALLAFFIFIFNQGIAQIYPVDTLMRSGERGKRINLVYLSDGYKTAQLPVYITDATSLNTALFAQAPFLDYKNYFNAFAISVPSAESGAKHPGTAADEATAAGQPVTDPDNVFRSTFDYFSIHRLLVPQNDLGIIGALSSNLPDYSQIFMVVNSPYYGGSGGAYATASTDASSAEVAIHEIGHSFAGLADEYWAGEAYAAEKPNMTANGNPATVKWKNWVGINGIGVYPYGNGGTPANWYRPHQTCKMQFLGYPFCAVCTERFIDVIHQKISMIDDYTPATTSFTLSNTNAVDLSVTAIQTNPSTISINWYLNGSATPFATDQYNVSIPYASLNTGNNTVRAELIDNTTLSKSYLPGIGYIEQVNWTINNPITLPVHLLSFSGKIANDNGLLSWNIDTPDDLQTFELEKSRDGTKFSKLASLTGKASAKNYNYTDEKLFPSDNYYRLKIIEKGGSSYYSNIIRLKNAFDKFYYKVYQNAAGHIYHLSVGTTAPAKISFKVNDIQGKTVIKKDLGNAQQSVDYDFDLYGKPAGIYFMTLYFGGYSYSVQLVAQ